MFTLKFWKEAGERAAKSAAQAILGGFTMDIGFNLLTMNWKLTCGLALGGALYSVLTSIASVPVGDTESASLVD
jgi:hypothetical protein